MKHISSILKRTVFIMGCISFISNLDAFLPEKTALAETTVVDSSIVETDNFMDYSQAVSDLSENQSDITPEEVAGLDAYYTKRLIVKAKNDSVSYDKYMAETMVKGPDYVTILQFSTKAEMKDCLMELNKNKNIEFAEPDILYGLEASFDKNTAIASEAAAESKEMGIKSTYKSWGVKKVESDKYNKYLAKKKKTEFLVAVVDTGVSNHKFLKGRIAKGGYDFSGGDNNPSDMNGHGTHVAGTIVDCTPNLNVKILPVRVLNQNGVGNSLTIANGIRYAADKGAKVINLSLGGDHSQYIENAVTYAMKKGAVVVVAAGNEYENVEYSCPAHIKKCITVAAIDSNERRADFSNYGSMVDVAGPGVDILSCVPGGGYVYASGTSMAAPHISAVAAMVRLSYPSKSPAEVEKIVKSISKDLGTKGWDRYFGFGLPKLTKIINAKKIRLSDTSAKIMKNSKYKLTATVTPGGFVTWSSSNSKIASVDQEGLVKTKKIGKTVITAKTVNGLKASCDLWVISDKVPEVEPDKISLNKSKVSIKSGETHTLYGTIKPENATIKDITWSSSDAVVADVSEFGTVTGYHSGKAVITAASINGLSAQCEVTVTTDGSFPTKVTLNQKKLNVLIGDNLPVWAAAAPETATDKRLKWSCNNDNLTIHANGTIKAVKEGTSILRVSTMNSLYDECEVTIIDPKNVIEPKDISLSQNTVRIEVEEMTYLFATVKPSNATDPTVTFSSSNTLIADVTQDGIVIGKRKGNTTVTARTSNGLKATCSVMVSDKAVPATGIILNKTEVELYVHGNQKLTATVLPANAADKKVTWSVADKTIAEVDSYGYVYANREGSTVVTAKTSNGLTAACTVTVKSQPILPSLVTFDWNSIKDIEVGQTVTFKAEIYPQNATERTLTYSSSNPAVAQVDNNGAVTGVKEGNAKITVKTSNGKTDTITVYVKAGTVKAEAITLNKSEIRMKPNDWTVLVATISPDKAADKQLTWESSHPEIAYVSKDGMVSAYNVGETVITVKTSNGLSAACKVIVELTDAIPITLTLNYNQLELEAGKTAILTAAITPDTTPDKTVTFMSSDPSVLDVSSSGVITAYKSGTAVVTVTTAQGVSAVCTVTVKEALIYPQFFKINSAFCIK